MENPSEWNEVEKLIHETMRQTDIDFVHNRGGDSYVRRLYKALKEAGYINDTDQERPESEATDPAPALLSHSS